MKTASKEASEQPSEGAGLEQPSEQLDLSFEPDTEVETVQSEAGVATFVEKQDFSKETPMDSEGYIGGDYWDDGEWKPSEVGRTPNGAILQIIKTKEGHWYKLQFQGSGELPMEYRGLYTSYSKADVAARRYLATRWSKEDAKAAS